MAAEAERLGLHPHGRLHGGDLAGHGAGHAAGADGRAIVDLDGPLLLAGDRPDGLVYGDSLVYPATPALWG